MKLAQLKVGPMLNFVYVLADESSGEAMVVDSGWEIDPIVSELERLKAKTDYVVVTHSHFDHEATARELAGRVGAKLVAHRSSPLDCDVRVEDGDELALGDSEVRVIHTPGHTQDSICLLHGDVLMTGDTLFVGTIGRFDRGMAATMFHSLHDVILRLPQDTVILPGHDYGEVPRRSIADERLLNPFLGAPDLKTFLSIAS
jgi:hydroxyacylglutathione hydrolase